MHIRSIRRNAWLNIAPGLPLALPTCCVLPFWAASINGVRPLLSTVLTLMERPDSKNCRQPSVDGKTDAWRARRPRWSVHSTMSSLSVSTKTCTEEHVNIHTHMCTRTHAHTHHKQVADRCVEVVQFPLQELGYDQKWDRLDKLHMGLLSFNTEHGQLKSSTTVDKIKNCNGGGGRNDLYKTDCWLVGMSRGIQWEVATSGLTSTQPSWSLTQAQCRGEKGLPTGRENVIESFSSNISTRLSWPRGHTGRKTKHKSITIFFKESGTHNIWQTSQQVHLL